MGDLGAGAGLGRRVNVARRELHRGRVWRIGAARRIGTHEGFDVLWHPQGQPVLRPFHGERELRIPGDEDWSLESRPASSSSVGFVRPGDRYSLWLIFVDDVFVHWYVNLERDGDWHGACFDHVDEKLDLLVDADLTVRFKDEDELSEAARLRYLDEADVRAQASAVLAHPPWPTGWEEFRPDPSWPLPELPPGWQAGPLRSERLVLAPLCEADLGDYQTLRGDPRTRVFSRSGAPVPPEQAQRELEESSASWRANDFGNWCVRAHDGTFVGVIHAVPGGDPPSPELGWTLAPEHWGRGLATEAARLVVADLLERARATRVTSFLQTANTASARIAQKLGLHLAETSGGVARYELVSGVAPEL